MADDSSEIVKEAAESVAFSNVKVIGDVPAFYTGLAMKQAVEASAGWTSLNQSIVGKVAESIMHTSAAEGGADLAALAGLVKLVQTIPPVTTGGPTGGGT
jgi:hypothetical protein